MPLNDDITVVSTIEKRRLALAKARQAKKDSGKVTVRRNPLEIFRDNPTSLRKAINAKCYDCSNYQREEVTHCTVKACPLWELRPWKA